MAKQSKEEKVSEALELLKRLEKLMDERIVDLHEIKGMMQARHAYCYYRKCIWEIQRVLEGKCNS